MGDTVAAQATQFFVAGYDTSASAIAHTLYELALNQDIQEKLRKEILFNIEEHYGITYEGLNKLKYLEMCIKGKNNFIPQKIFQQNIENLK